MNSRRQSLTGEGRGGGQGGNIGMATRSGVCVCCVNYLMRSLLRKHPQTHTSTNISHCTQTFHAQERACARARAHTHTHTHFMHKSARTHTHAHAQERARAHTHTYTHTHTHTFHVQERVRTSHTHTSHAQAQIHTCVCVSSR